MFKNIFFLGLTSSFLATAACMVYSQMYFSILVDFSEATGIMTVLTNCLIGAMAACFVFIALTKLIKKTFIAEFVFNLLVTLASISAVFLLLKSNDPVFVNEDAQLMIDYYKGFVMPMLFFPALAWFTLKPIFVRK
jgi:hypothetical protein